MDARERVVIGVLVPWDLTRPIQDIQIFQKRDTAISCFMDHCKAHYSTVALQGKQIEKYHQSLVEQAKGQQVSEEMMARLAKSTMVDMVVLHPNRKENGYIAVNMYVDDKGVAKELPVNQRATSICQACGLSTQVLGDAFIGKQFDDDDGFQRIDFASADLSSNNSWMDVAREANLKMSQASKLSDKEQSKPMNSSARDLKDKGNDFFAKKEYQSAISEYTKAIDLLGVEISTKENSNPVIHALFSNRSACYLQLGDFNSALRDAESCVLVRPSWFKGWGRKADALLKLKDYGGAKSTLETSINLCTNADVRQEFQTRLSLIDTFLK